MCACAERPPATITVPVTLPTPSATQTSQAIEPRATKAEIRGVDDGDFASEFGTVHIARESDGTIAGTYSTSVLTCTLDHEVLACSWYERSTEGRATFHRKPDGHYEGTWGNGTSDSDGGAWNLTPIVRVSPIDGLWDTNWGAATIRTTGRNVHVDYASGSMDCEQRDRKLACNWTEGSLAGNAELAIESPRLIRGRWGNGQSATDGGSWVFVRR